MRIRIRKAGLGSLARSVLFLGLLLSLTLGIGITGHSVFGVNYTNETVIARVNVTNTEPNITSVILEDGPSVPANEIDLTSNGIKVVYCNATVFDYNGASDIGRANASIYIGGIAADAPDDNNHKYTNSSCGACSQLTSTTARCSCRFAVQYYANYSPSWICNMTVKDNGGTQVPARQINLTDSEASSPVTFTKLLAINTTTLLDYGNLTVTETSSLITHNVTNAGNTRFNLTLRGYGGSEWDDPENITQNLSMVCEFGNISIGNQRYALGTERNDSDFNSMEILPNLTRRTNFTFPHRVDDASVGGDRNSTFWRLQVPLSVGGLCNGTIIFGAVEAN